MVRSAHTRGRSQHGDERADPLIIPDVVGIASLVSTALASGMPDVMTELLYALLLCPVMSGVGYSRVETGDWSDTQSTVCLD